MKEMVNEHVFFGCEQTLVDVCFLSKLPLFCSVEPVIKI